MNRLTLDQKRRLAGLAKDTNDRWILSVALDVFDQLCKKEPRKLLAEYGTNCDKLIEEINENNS